MADYTMVSRGDCPRCGEPSEIIMSVADAEHGATLRWAKAPIEECYPGLSAAELHQMKTGIHPYCQGETQ